MIPAGETENCISCLKPLTAEEKHYYEYHCEKCEGELWHRIQRWRKGAKDDELDSLFDISKEVK